MFQNSFSPFFSPNISPRGNPIICSYELQNLVTSKSLKRNHFKGEIWNWRVSLVDKVDLNNGCLEKLSLVWQRALVATRTCHNPSAPTSTRKDPREPTRTLKQRNSFQNGSEMARNLKMKSIKNDLDKVLGILLFERQLNDLYICSYDSTQCTS